MIKEVFDTNSKHPMQTIRARLLWVCIKLLFGKEGVVMMAMFFAQRVILDKTKFADVPAKLKQPVADILIESGLDFLVPTEFGGTAA